MLGRCFLCRQEGTHLYLGGFRNLNYLPASAIAGLDAQRDRGSEQRGCESILQPVQPCDPAHSSTAILRTRARLGGQRFPKPQLLLHSSVHIFSGDCAADRQFHLPCSPGPRSKRNFRNGLQFLLTYTWSKSIDNASATDDSSRGLAGANKRICTVRVQRPYCPRQATRCCRPLRDALSMTGPGVRSARIAIRSKIPFRRGPGEHGKWNLRSRRITGKRMCTEGMGAKAALGKPLAPQSGSGSKDRS